MLFSMSDLQCNVICKVQLMSGIVAYSLVLVGFSTNTRVRSEKQCENSLRLGHERFWRGSACKVRVP